MRHKGNVVIQLDEYCQLKGREMLFKPRDNTNRCRVLNKAKHYVLHFTRILSGMDLYRIIIDYA